MKGYFDAEQLKNMKYEELKALAKEMGVNASGKKEEIIKRIAAEEIDAPEEERTKEETDTVTVKAIKRFLDKQLKQIKEIGNTYKVSRTRAEKLEAAGVAAIEE